MVVDQAAEPDAGQRGQTRKMPATMPVANTERVSRKTQNVMANQTVKLITDTSRVLTSRCRNARSEA